MYVNHNIQRKKSFCVESLTRKPQMNKKASNVSEVIFNIIFFLNHLNKYSLRNNKTKIFTIINIMCAH